MKRALALVYVAGLFLLGILVGGLGMHLHDARQLPRPPLHHGGGPRHHPGAHAFLERLEQHLDLTAEQNRQLREILDDSRADARALHEELLPRVNAHMEHMRQRIAKILTPEQQETFEELHRQHRHGAERLLLGH